MKLTDLYRLSDSDLITELQAFQTQVATSPPDYGLIAADTVAMSDALLDLTDKVSSVTLKRAELDSALAARDASRSALVDLAKAQFKTARAKSGITGTSLAAANLDEYDTTRTRPSAPDSTPVAMVDFAKLQHIIRFRDSKNPDSAGKPKGVMGSEIWVKIDGDPPTDEKECMFLALDTASPYTAVYSGAEGGKTAHYLLRWVSTQGDKGPWSEVVSATINA
jgi:hypothetical protein